MLYQFKLRQIFYYKLMQGLNKNKADIITQLHMQKERGGVQKQGGGGMCNMDSTKVVRQFDMPFRMCWV